MLKELLRELGESKRMQTPEELARTLGVTPSLIEDMIQRLALQGYLTESAQCSDGCTGCPLQSGCSTRQQSVHFWTLTSKAERLLSS